MSKRNEEWEEAVNVLIRALENIAQSMCDDYVKKNAEFRSNAGLNPKIIRRMRGETCPWCRQLAGTYEYGKEPHEVYQRHDNCDCTVEYVTEKGSQNVHTKQQSDGSSERVSRAKATEAATAEADAAAKDQRIATTKATEIEAREKSAAARNQRIAADKTVATSANSGIIRPSLQKQLPYVYNGEKMFIPAHTEFEATKSIAGKGAGKAIRVESKLIEKYGGNPGEWSKRVGKIESNKYIFDVHWYELNDKQYEPKLKHRKEK